MNDNITQNNGIGIPLAGTGGNIPAIESVNNPVSINPAARGLRSNNDKDTPDKNGFDTISNNKNMFVILIIALYWLM